VAPQISVIIPTYNRQELTVRAIKSVLSQTFSDLECIVVDDGSTDQTAEKLAKEFGESIQLIRQANKGVSRARNRGIAIAQGRYLAFLDSDDEWLPRKLEKQIAFMAAHPEFRICQTTEIWFRKGKRVNLPEMYKKKGGRIFDRSLACCMITPSSVLLEQSLLHEMGNFDETMLVCEDYDLWLRVTSRHPVGLIEEDLLIRYGGAPDQLSGQHSQDRFRIRALQKWLNVNEKGRPDWRLAFKALEEKCRIYGSGCLKRGKEEEGERILAIPGEMR